MTEESHRPLVRHLCARDADEFLRLRREALETDPTAFGESLEEHLAIPIAQTVQRLDDAGDDAFVLGAFDRDALVATTGFARYERLKMKHKGRLWGVYVTPRARRRGIARALVAEILRRADALGLAHITATVSATQAAAVALYASLGFVRFGREPRALHVDGRDIDQDLMVLTLR